MREFSMTPNILGLILESMAEGVNVCNNDGIMVYTNHEFDTMFGYEKGELIGQHVTVLNNKTAEENGQLFTEIITRLHREKIVTVELENRKKSGEIFYSSSRISRLEVSGKIYWITVQQDVSRQKIAEIALVASELRYKAIVNTQREFITRSLPGGILTFVNDALSSYVGLPQDELLGKSYYPFIFEEDREHFILGLASLSAANPVYDCEVRVQVGDGDCRWHQWSNHAIFDQNGALVEYQSVGRDITDRRQLEEALRNSQERYRRFIATATEGIGIIDKNCIVTYANDSLAEMLGHDLGDLIGKPSPRLLATDGKPEFMTQAIERGHGLSSKQECLYRRKDGTHAWLLVSSSPIMDNDATFQGFFAMFTDLTLRKEMELSLMEAKEVLESRVKQRTAALAKANKMTKKISIELVHAEERERKRIAGELHDRVGQSLLLAKMKLDMLATNAAYGADYQHTQEVATIVEKTIQDIRSLTFTMRPAILETAEIDTALELLCRSIGSDYGLQIQFSSDDREKPLSGEARYSLYMAIRELILNIVKHAGVARAHITVGTTSRNLVIHVVDNGAGFDEQAEQKNLATTKRFGLFSVHHRIEGMGGTFAIESAIGQGTHATILVPMTEQ